MKKAIKQRQFFLNAFLPSHAREQKSRNFLAPVLASFSVSRSLSLCVGMTEDETKLQRESEWRQNGEKYFVKSSWTFVPLLLN
jgi:hypothetical protein